MKSKEIAELKRKHMTQLAQYRKELRKSPQLRTLFWEVTAKCNEHCRHCGSNCNNTVNSDLLTQSEVCNFLAGLKKDFPIEKLRFCVTGGEPLLREDFFEIMEYANRIGYSWGMTSNGTLIDEEVAGLLKKTGMKTISISVDGLKDTHDWFRQKKGSYELTMQGIKNLLDTKAFGHVQITTVVFHKNIEQLEEMYHVFSTLGVKSWRVINIEPIGRAKDKKDLLLNRDEYLQMFDFIRKKRFAGPMEVTYGCSHYLGVEWEREVREWYFLCNAGVYTASILYNGDIGACLDIERREELIQGNIRTDRFLDVWKNRFEVFRTDSRKCEGCSDYEFCCGDSFHTWNFDENRPNVCMKGILFKGER